MIRLQPLPPARRVGSNLLLAVKIESPTGWLDLENAAGGYEIEASSFGEAAVTLRRTMAESNFVAGSFTLSAVPENVTETLAVYVKGATREEFTRRRLALETCFTQLSYRLMVRIDDVAIYYDCEAADYSVSTPRELLHARMGLVKAQVPRHPVTEVVLASGDEL